MDGGRQRLGRTRPARAFSDDEAPTKPRSGVVIVARRTGEIASGAKSVKVKTIRIARPPATQAPAPVRRVRPPPLPAPAPRTSPLPSLPEPETLPRPIPCAPATLRDVPSFDETDAIETVPMAPPAPRPPPRERRYVTPPARLAPRIARRPRRSPSWALRIALVLSLVAIEIVLADPTRFGIDLSDLLLPTIHDIVTSPDP